MLDFRRSNLGEKVSPIILKDDFPPRTHLFMFTCLIRPGKQNQFSFSSIEFNKPLPAPVDQIQVQKTILVVAIDQKPDHS